MAIINYKDILDKYGASYAIHHLIYHSAKKKGILHKIPYEMKEKQMHYIFVDYRFKNIRVGYGTNRNGFGVMLNDYHKALELLDEIEPLIRKILNWEPVKRKDSIYE